MKGYHGKVIYNPSGKAQEYSYWAANFYNGCSAKCDYCYNRHSRSAKIVGGDVPTLKKSLKDEETAIWTFRIEAMKNIEKLVKHGLFFNFVSDPCLKETIALNFDAITWAAQFAIPCKILTKQGWWVNQFLENFDKLNVKKEYFQFGFTLTGHDELEPGASPNQNRIEAMKKLHDAGFKTWASIEPVIDIESSWRMIINSSFNCDLYKIGVQSGKKFNKETLYEFVNSVTNFIDGIDIPGQIYWKDTLIKQAGISRENLPANCVTRNFNL